MKKLNVLIILSIAILLGIKCLTDLEKSNNQDSYFFGQEFAGKSPEIFAPEIISKGFHEHAIAISPKEDEIFYVMADINYQFNTIIQIKKINDRWVPPEVAPFSGKYKDLGGCFNSDGTQFLFASKRPVNGSPENKLDIWITKKINGVWSEPINIGSPINSEHLEGNPSLDADNNLYFQSNRDGNWDLYFSEYVDGAYVEPVVLDLINTPFNESDPCISPDGSYLLFHSNRNDPRGLMDIYVSFKEEEKWTAPVNLGENINTWYSDFGSSLSPDGQYLFFSSYRSYNAEDFAGKTYEEMIELYESPQNGYATLYWVDAEIIEGLKKAY